MNIVEQEGSSSLGVGYQNKQSRIQADDRTKTLKMNAI